MSNNMPPSIGQVVRGSCSFSLPIRSRNPGPAQNMANQSMDLRFDSANQTQNEPKPQNEPRYTLLTYEESEEETEDETSEYWSDDSMENEEEIIVYLNQRALAMLPRRLQRIMSEMHTLRYMRLKLENPDVRVMPEDYWITPLQPLGPTRVMRAPTPLLAMPQRIVSSTAYQDGFRDGYESGQTAYAQAQAQAYIQSLGPGNNPRRWSAQVTPSRNAFAAAPPVNVNFSRRKLRHNSHGILQPENGFHVLNGYHRPLPPNLVFTQQYNNSTNIRGGSGLKSLSIKPVAKSLRKGFKRSLSRLNKWMKS